MYGPLWINATLAFAIILTGNMHQNLKLDSDSYSFNAVTVSIAFATVFVYALIWPGGIYLLGKCFGAAHSFLY